MLARQIEAGAPADVFVSANEAWMDALEEQGLIDAGSRVDLLRSRLVLVAHGDAAAPVGIGPEMDLAALLDGGRLAMGLVDSVPAGIYAKAALEGLGQWGAVEPMLAQTDNVRAALALVAAGEAPYGIVYATDAVAEDGVTVVGTFPEDSHPPIVYPAAVVAASDNPLAAEYLAFLQGPTRRGRRSSGRASGSSGTERDMLDWLGPEEWTAVRLSLRVSLWATLVSLPLGIFVAYALARWTFPGRQILNGLVHMPLILPPVVTGYLLLLTFGTQGPVGSLLQEIGIVFAFNWTGAALAAGIMAFPLMVRAIRLSIEAVDPKLEQAGATLGAGPLWVFATVTLPLILPGVIAGAILAFAKAMGEFGATITFVSNIPGQTRTIPSAIYAFLQVPGGDGAALKLVAVSIIVAMTALLLSEVLARRVARRVAGA